MGLVLSIDAIRAAEAIFLLPPLIWLPPPLLFVHILISEQLVMLGRPRTTVDRREAQSPVDPFLMPGSPSLPSSTSFQSSPCPSG